jgi:cytochrome c6
MTKSMRIPALLAMAVFISGAPAFAQSGEALYKSNCQACHGPSGTPNPAMAKALGIKAVSDPDMKRLTADQEFDVVKNGKNKMKGFSGKLTDDEIKNVVAYFRRLK